jgi:sodium/potassium-transporting ATPase subunit alpha
VEEVCQRYDVTANSDAPQLSAGLSAAEVAERLARDGPNMMTPPKEKSSLKLFLECLSSLFNLLLVLASIFTFILYGIDPIANGDNVRILFFSFFLFVLFMIWVSG